MIYRLLFLIKLFFLCQLFYAQTRTDLEIDDINDALEMTGFNIFKYNFGTVKTDYMIHISIEEIIRDSIISTKEIIFRPIQPTNEQSNEIKIISRRDNDTSDLFIIKFFHPTMYQTIPITINENYRKPHFWTEVEEGNLIYNKKIPLLLYGSMWESELPGGEKVMRYCWGTELKRDLSNEELKNIEHLFLLSYELK